MNCARGSCVRSSTTTSVKKAGPPTSRSLKPSSEWVSISGATLECRDPDDDKLLETALIGKADCLVTGDGDLLVMSPFRHIPILQAVAFLESFRVFPP